MAALGTGDGQQLCGSKAANTARSESRHPLRQQHSTNLPLRRLVGQEVVHLGAEAMYVPNNRLLFSHNLLSLAGIYIHA